MKLKIVSNNVIVNCCLNIQGLLKQEKKFQIKYYVINFIA